MITNEQYTQHVLSRASSQWHGECMDFDDLREILQEYIKWGQRLDVAKKALMYGRNPYPNSAENSHGGHFGIPIDTETPPIHETAQGIAHAILGVATEGVELIEALQNYLFDGAVDFDHVNLQEEFGDVEWYRTLGLFHVNQTHEENITQNDKKLEKRFGPVSEGFTYKSANERDLEGERAALEGKDASDAPV